MECVNTHYTIIYIINDSQEFSSPLFLLSAAPCTALTITLLTQDLNLVHLLLLQVPHCKIYYE